jgi:ATP-binding cassette subfamily B protein
MTKIKVFLGTIMEVFHKYRSGLIALFIFGVVSAILDGVGINSIIPMLSLIFNGATDVPQDTISVAIKDLFTLLGIPFSFKFLIVFMGILFLLRAVTLAMFSYIRAKIGANFVYGESHEILKRLSGASWYFLSKQKTGYLQNTLYWDIRQSASLLDVIAQFIQSATGFVIYFVIAFSISPLLMIVTSFAGIILLISLKPLVKKTADIGNEKSQVEKLYSGYLIEHIIGLKTIKASGVGTYATEAGRKILEKLKIAYTKSGMLSVLGTTIIQPFSLIFILILFAFAYKTPSFNIASFAAMLYLIQKIFVYLQSTQGTIQSVADMMPFASNILKFKKLLKDQGIRENQGTDEFSFTNELKFNKVSFSYDDRTSIIKDVSFSIKKGEFIGIIGPSGSGKTSIVDLILRLQEPKTGTIFLDNKPINQIQLKMWQKHVGFVSQDIFVISETIMNNIRFYDNSISDNDIYEAAKKAHIYEDIMRMENGFNTLVGDRGTTLSTGQRQRVALARAFARKLSILILDEATSALDSESESKIKIAISEARKEITLIVVAHRMSTIMQADKIIVIKSGEIIDYSDVNTMLAKENSYLSHMINLQNI